ncbi:MAG: hypothetical protein V3T62_00370 [Alphaproteobacteria bacterium]
MLTWEASELCHGLTNAAAAATVPGDVLRVERAVAAAVDAAADHVAVAAEAAAAVGRNHLI